MTTDTPETKEPEKKEPEEQGGGPSASESEALLDEPSRRAFFKRVAIGGGAAGGESG